MDPAEINLNIPESGAVFAFGKNSPGRFHVKNDSVISAACGEGHALVATGSGRLFAFGQNDYGQLGLGHKNPGSTKPTCVRKLKEIQQKAVRVASGPTHSLVTSESGAVYGFGNNVDGQLVGAASNHLEPVEISQLKGMEVKELAAGRSFSLALTKNGDVHAWGSNAEGCLAVGSNVDELRDSVSERVPLPGKVVSLSAGSYHCACVLDDGRVFAWGESEGGKLGVPGADEKDIQYSPIQVQLPGEVKAKSVACGLQHTLVLTQTGQVMACGTGDSGQLGLGAGRSFAASLEVIQALEDVEIMGISAGERHSVCVSAKSGHLYTFGDALHGKLGPSSRLGGHSNQHRPFGLTALKSVRVRRAVCGTLLTLVLAVPRPESELGPSSEGDKNGQGDFEDDPLDPLSAKSPKPLRKLAEAQAAASADASQPVEALLLPLRRRLSSRSREKFRQSLVDKRNSMPDGTGSAGLEFELVRPAVLTAAPAAKSQALIENKQKPEASKTPLEKDNNEDIPPITKFDQLLKLQNGTGSSDKDEDVHAMVKTKPAKELANLKMERRPSKSQQADQAPEESPVLIESARQNFAEAPPLSASAAVALPPSGASAENRPVEDPKAKPSGEVTQSGDAVKAGCCGSRRSTSKAKVDETAADKRPLPPPNQEEDQKKEQQQQPQPQQHEDAAAATAAVEQPIVQVKGSSVEQQPAASAAEPGQQAEPVRNVGCGRGRRKTQPLKSTDADKPLQAVGTDEGGDGKTTKDEAAGEKKLEGKQPDDKASTPSGGSSDKVSGVGCGRRRRGAEKPEQAPKEPLAANEDGKSGNASVPTSDGKVEVETTVKADGEREGEQQEGPAAAPQPPNETVDAKKSRSCTLL